MHTNQRNIQDVHKDKILKIVNNKARRKKLIIQRVRMCVSVFILALAVVFILMMTPIFNIKTIAVSGNEMISIGSIEKSLNSMVGKNLFRVSGKDVKGVLQDVPYIEDVEISRKPFPPTLYIKITEIVPSAYVYVDGVRVVVDCETKVIDDSGAMPSGNIPQIIGLDEVKARKGRLLQIDDTEKVSAIKAILSTAKDVDIISKISEIDIGNTLAISFKYDNRLDVNCGSSLELARKIRIFKESVNNASMKEDAKGTFDLSEPGKAIYTPNQDPLPVLNDDENDEEIQETEETKEVLNEEEDIKQKSEPETENDNQTKKKSVKGSVKE